MIDLRDWFYPVVLGDAAATGSEET